jgi:hypothetical protein
MSNELLIQSTNKAIMNMNNVPRARATNGGYVGSMSMEIGVRSPYMVEVEVVDEEPKRRRSLRDSLHRGHF